MHTKLEDISHDIYQKTQQNKAPNRTFTRRLSVDIESAMNPFFLTSFLPRTVSRKLDLCLLTLLNFDALDILCTEYDVLISFYIHFKFHACNYSTFIVIFGLCSLHFHIRVKMAANHNTA